MKLTKSEGKEYYLSFSQSGFPYSYCNERKSIIKKQEISGRIFKTASYKTNEV